MKVCIFGAGAIGGYMGGRMTQAGIDVSLIARGPHLNAMRKNGLRYEDEDGSHTVQVTATDDPHQLGPQDYVIVSVKAISLAGGFTERANKKRILVIADKDPNREEQEVGLDYRVQPGDIITVQDTFF